MEKPGVGGNWQAIAKATSCQDNAWGHRCPPIPTVMLIAFQCLWDNLSNNCFSCFNSGLRAGNKREGTLFLTIAAKSTCCIALRASLSHYIDLSVKITRQRDTFCWLFGLFFLKFVQLVVWLADLSLIYCTFSVGRPFGGRNQSPVCYKVKEAKHFHLHLWDCLFILCYDDRWHITLLMEGVKLSET